MQSGDLFTVCVRASVTRLWLNGTQTAEVRDAGFAEAYLGIWLAEPALSKSLREDLLESVPES